MALKRLILGGAMTLAAAAAAVILPAQGAGPGGAGGVEISAPASGGAEKQAAAKLPEILRDTALLPAPVARIREQILEAARSGDIERLRPIIDGNGITPTFSFVGETDAIAFWKETSGDSEGRELLAIMSEIFEAGFLHSGAGTADEIYIWPYFAEIPLDKLTPAQQVELYRLVTAQDVKDMREFGSYIFYRAGITPDGQWQYFVAGD